jgi:hypothetical protein
LVLVAASQSTDVANSELFTGFLRFAQHETSDEPVAKRSLDVFLPNGHKMSVDIWNNAPSSTLLKVRDDHNRSLLYTSDRKEN